jgi:hypothetical protein
MAKRVIQQEADEKKPPALASRRLELPSFS